MITLLIEAVLVLNAVSLVVGGVVLVSQWYWATHKSLWVNPRRRR